MYMDVKQAFHCNTASRLVLAVAVGLVLFVMSLSFIFNATGAWKGGLPRSDYKRMQESDDAIFWGGLDQSSCHSRYDSMLHKPLLGTRKPSSYLVSKLRAYEARHKMCAPYTASYNVSVDALKSSVSGNVECKYVVWLPSDGLGNRVISLASTFLYALLTDRVLLVHPKDGISSLFCEPFPAGSWLLPMEFPLMHRIHRFKKESKESFGHLVRDGVLGGNATSPVAQPYAYIYLYPNYDDHDKRFFCDEDHSDVQDVPWLFLMSDLYFAPSFFSISSFREELHKIFPDKETVFYLLARYLFHPTNEVWGLVRRFYDAYLSEADVTVGIQIRILHFEKPPFQDVLNDIISCTTNQNLLPPVDKQKQQNRTLSNTKKKRKIVALLTSLSSDYFKELQKMYWEYATTTGEIVAIHQPSFEGRQATGNLNHDQKALAEMYLLSLTDSLVTSATSTFGYVAQGLGGLMPWMILKSKDDSGRPQPCRRVLSMEPCYLTPPNYDCKTRQAKDANETEPHLRRCVDGTLMGIKLVNSQTK